MPGISQNYDLAAIRDLLISAFTASDLRRLFLYTSNPNLRPLVAEFGPNYGLADLVDRVIEYCVVRALFPDLLDEVRLTNPRMYERFRSRLEPATTGPAALPPAGSLPEPGPLPPGSRLPFARNAMFTGRDEALLGLAQVLLYDDELCLYGIQGMGGVGKTQLAAEFAHRYGQFYEGVHWLSAAQPGLLEGEIVACGLAMSLPNWPDTMDKQVALTLKVWSAGGRRLVVVDDLEDVEAARQWLPRLCGDTPPSGRNGGVRVLVTTRRADWPEDVTLDLLELQQVRLDAFSSAESVAFLRRYLPEDRASDEDLVALAERLGNLPLALEMAGAYLQGLPDLTVRDYRAQLDETAGDPSMRGWRTEADSPTEHELDLATAFSRSWQQVTDGTAQHLFLATSYCSPNHPIPPKLLQRTLGLGDSAYDEALASLIKLGLLEVETPAAGPTIQRLLADYARSLRFEQDPLPDLAAALVEVADESMQDGLPAGFVPLRAHVEAVADHAEAAGLEEAAGLWNELGFYQQMVADYAGALETFERVLALAEATYGPDHPYVGISVGNLGSVQQDLGNLEEARAAFERAVSIAEAALGPDHPNVAIGVNNLGKVLHEQGDLEGARAAFERALKIDEATYGPEHPDVAICVNNLGMVLMDLGDLEGALNSIERALTIEESILGPEHPTVASTLSNLGTVLQAMDRLEEARAAFQQALSLDERAFGASHPNVARDVSNLGSVLLDLGNLEGARDAFEQALNINEAAYGPDHPIIALRVSNLAVVLQATGDLDRARAALERALQIHQATSGPDHPVVGSDLADLGSVLREMGEFGEARAALERALEIEEQNYGLDHANVAPRISALGALRHELGDLEGAAEAFERALKLDEKSHGSESPHVARDANSLGLVLQDMGDLEGALAALQRALDIDEAVYGSESSMVTLRLNNLGVVLYDLGDLVAAEKALRRAQELEQAGGGEGSFLLGLVLNNLGMTAEAMGDQAQGQEYYSQARIEFEAMLGPDARDVAILATNLGQVMYAIQDLGDELSAVVRWVPPEELVGACLDESSVLFGGVGLSTPAGYPGWGALAQNLLDWGVEREIVSENRAARLRMAIEAGDSGAVVDGIVEAVRKEDRRGELDKQLTKLFLEPEAIPAETHKTILQAGFPVVLTTNYDPLLERAYGDGVEVYTPWDGDDLLEALSKRKPLILKLKGTLERPDTVLLAPTQYRDAVRDSRAFAQFMSSLFVSRTILFLGASLEDIALYFEGIEFRESGRQHYALVGVSGSAWEVQAEQLQRRYNIEVLPYHAGKPVQELVFVRRLVQRLEAKPQEALVGAQVPRWTRLRRVHLVDVGPFEKLTVDLDDDWNVLLGDNGVGKSSILKAIALAICGEAGQAHAERLIRVGRNRATITLETAEGRRYVTKIRRDEGEVKVTSRPERPLEIEGWLALGFPPLRGLSRTRSQGPEPLQPRRRLDPEDLLHLLRGGNDPRINGLKQWIVNLDYRAVKEKVSQSKRLYDDFWQVVETLTVGVTFGEGQVDPKTYQVTVMTNDGRVPIEVISQGTQSLVGWVGVLLERLYEYYDETEQPRDCPALVLIDEIDAHMHPLWQQVMVPQLSALFPNVQFIATSHSPLVVAELGREQVWVLERDLATKQVRAERASEDFSGLRADQMLTSSLFGLAATRGKRGGVEDKIAEYSELLGKEARSEAEQTRFEALRTELERWLVAAETPAQRKVEIAVRETLEEMDLSGFAVEATAPEELPPDLKLELKRKLSEFLGDSEEAS